MFPTPAKFSTGLGFSHENKPFANLMKLNSTNISFDGSPQANTTSPRWPSWLFAVAGSEVRDADWPGGYGAIAGYDDSYPRTHIFLVTRCDFSYLMAVTIQTNARKR